MFLCLLIFNYGHFFCHRLVLLGTISPRTSAAHDNQWPTQNDKAWPGLLVEEIRRASNFSPVEKSQRLKGFEMTLIRMLCSLREGVPLHVKMSAKTMRLDRYLMTLLAASPFAVQGKWHCFTLTKSYSFIFPSMGCIVSLQCPGDHIHYGIKSRDEVCMCETVCEYCVCLCYY